MILRDEKITEIMTLAGVAPDDFPDAKGNYAKLSEAEINLRLDRLRAGAKVVKAWRDKEYPARQPEYPRWKGILEGLKGLAPSLPPTWVPASRELAALQRLDRHYDVLIHALDTRTGRPTWTRALLRQLAELFTGSAAVGVREFLVPRLQAIASSDVTAAAAMRQIEEFLKHPLLPEDNPRLTVTGTVEALARVENIIDANRPDVIVAVNEGAVIGSVVAQHLNLPVPIVHVRASAQTGVTWLDDQSVLSSAKTVCVMGHFASTGKTLRKTMEMARAYGHPNRVYCAVLASSVDALDNLQDCAYHQLVSGSKIDLSFDPSKGVTVESDTFILGGTSGADHDALPITRGMLDRSRIDMKRMYPG